MLKAIIEASVRNRFLVILASVFLAAGGIYAVKNIPLDAIPDLSDVQVIVFTEFPGQAPQVVEDQVTYPLTTAMLSVPRAQVVRGYSFFGLSFVYIIFEDGTDLYWARSRVLEYLNFASKRLPAGVTPSLGPDATGVGWVYEYALVDKTGKHDLAELRTMQDWFLRYELQTVPGVSEVASVGGYVKQYQVEVDPNKLVAYDIPLSKVIKAIKASNNDVGGRLVEMAETEFMVRGFGYIKSLDDIRNVALGVDDDGTPILLKDVANVHIGPELRRGIAELDGEGEVAGGIVLMRFGENALKTIALVKKKLEELKKSLPEGVEIVEAYDRSDLIHRAVKFLKEKLLEESVIVALVCLVFLMHIRSAFVAILTLPLGILMAMTAMNWWGINANIMSLGGIAIAIGAMIDASVVMIENAHKHLERDKGKKPHMEIMLDAAKEVGPALFFSLLIITLSFLPVFTLEQQEGRLFKPLAFTKTFSMAAAALLAVTLTPVLMLYLVRGSITPEKKNPVNILLMGAIRPIVRFALKYKTVVILGVFVSALLALGPLARLGSEFMPPLNEGDILYMPSALPGISVTKARELLQRTDRILKTFPEVERVFGKIGRAKTATDPAPLTMEEGRLFKPLAFTKTFSMAAAALLAVTLTPVLMLYLVRGSITPEKKNPVNILLMGAIRPIVRFALKYKTVVILGVFVSALLALGPLARLGSEFMPPLNEGDILYMPSALPGISVTKARELLQRTDRILKTFPEVERVFGKIGRAETATDPAPLTMVETIAKLKPRDQWRPGVTMKSLMNEMDAAIRFPGVTNAWTMPIKTRIDMLSTGIKTPVGIKVAGPDLAVLDKVAKKIESVIRNVPGTRSVYAERVVGGSFLDFDIDREKVARYGLTVGDVQDVIKSAIGGTNVSYTVEGLERYPINVRYGRELRDNLASLKRALVYTPGGQQIPMSQLATIRITNGPPVIKTENSRPNAWIYVDLAGIDIGTYVKNAIKAVNAMVKLPAGVSVAWSGQYEYMQRVQEKLKLVVPVTIGIIFVLLYLNFGNITESLIVLLTIPLSTIGGLFFIDYLGYDFSVAVGVGFIALAGVASEIGVLILLYIDHAVEKRKKENSWASVADVRSAVLEGVSERVRPIMMTVAAIVGGLAPIMYGHGTGAQVMRRIAAPMIGGMTSVTILSLVALPVVYCFVLELRFMRDKRKTSVAQEADVL